MGTVKAGGTGCLCPENALLKALVTHLLLRRDEILILDMEAGVEHIGRGTASAVDAFVVVVEPGRRSIQTAHTIHALAQDLGIDRVYAVGNKTRSPDDEEFIRSQMEGFEILGFLPSDQLAIAADQRGEAVFDTAPHLVEIAQKISSRLEADAKAR
jgi:CO dehydrogenase maturation factor